MNTIISIGCVVVGSFFFRAFASALLCLMTDSKTQRFNIRVWSYRLWHSFAIAFVVVSIIQLTTPMPSWAAGATLIVLVGLGMVLNGTVFNDPRYVNVFREED
jgi:hypothetical protein